MRKQIIITVVIAVVIIAAVAFAWWWFLSSPPQPPNSSIGTFGSAQNVPATDTTGGTTGTPTNIGTPTIGETASNGNGNIGSGASGSTNGGNVPVTSGTTVSSGATQSVTVAGGSTSGTGEAGAAYVPGVTWISSPTVTIAVGTTGSGSTAGAGGANTSGTVFNPTPINGVVSSNPQGGIIPQLGSTGNNGQQDNSGLGLAGTVGVAAAAGALSCGAAQAFDLLGVTTGAATAGATAGGFTVAGGSAASADYAARSAIAVQSVDLGPDFVLSLGTNPILTTIATTLGGASGGQSANNSVQTFWGCLARTIAKITLQQLTNSVVNWINSGFNGSPSFVQNPTQFLQNTADNAAGAFIQSSALSFLCSPFQLQIKIAIAQSYANRNAQSCSLTSVSNNIQNFINGDFNSGGWPAFLSFTTTPTNNPYGAFMYATVGLNGAVSSAVSAKQTDLLQGNGFLSFQQQTNCKVYGNAVGAAGLNAPPPNPNQKQTSIDDGNAVQVCDLQTTTPGTVIAASIDKTLGESQDSLNMAKDFDEIISALISQLMTNALQGGLSNLSNNGNGYSSNYYTPDQLAAQASSQTLLVQMQSDTNTAQEYGGVEQGSIQDIETAQSQLQSLINCWNNAATAASSTNTTAAQTDSANATTTQAQLNSLGTQITTYNNNITRANGAITLLEQLESSALSAASSADINNITSAYQSAQAQGQLISIADLTTAQQDRATLQAQMSTIGQQTNIGLQQCSAASTQ